MSVALATTYHDAKDRMYDQIAEVASPSTASTLKAPSSRLATATPPR